MNKDINLNSTQWCDIIFDGKNKEYGAFQMRQTSSDRHIMALLITFTVTIFIAFLPKLVKTVQEARGERESFTDVNTISELPIDTPEPENVIEQQELPPPPKILETVKFTPPTIVNDELVTAENELKSTEELLKTKTVIGVYDNPDGSTDKDARALEDLARDNQIIQQAPAAEKVHIHVEEMPAFPGGESEMMKFISNNLKYPVIAIDNQIQGRVIVSFVVNKTGEIVDVKIVKGIDPSCDKEALRVVKMMPKWIPGKQNGNLVRVQYTLPVLFRLQN